MPRPGIWVLSLALAAVLIGCQSPTTSKSLFEHQGGTMGTTFSVKVVVPDSLTRFFSAPEFRSGIDSLLIDVNQQMSTYITDSEISRFNRFADTSWFAVSPDFARVMKEALRLHQLSGFALDITVGPLVNLWGFGPEKRGQAVPDEQELQNRLADIGAQYLDVQTSPPRLRKRNPRLVCDLSSIAKGFAVDRIGEYLEKGGIGRYLVEIGGETRTRGRNHLNQPWRIGISTPDQSGQLQKILRLNNMSVATSGDYHNYFEEDGVRYSHTIDPRTGKPITHRLASVTVIDASCMTADGLATALDVLGPVAGWDLAVKLDLPAMFVVRTDQGFEELATSAFEEIFRMKE